MMTSMSFEVKFSVRAKTRPGEVVCIVGDAEELGKWNPQAAIYMRRQTKRISPSEEDVTQSCFEECSEDGDIWSKVVRLHGFTDLQYRYFICRQFASENEGDSAVMIIKWWEGHIKPRVFSPQEAMKLRASGIVPDPDMFGEYDDIRLINWGWLTGYTSVQLRLHSNPIKMWKPRYRQQTYSVRCTPMDHRYKEWLREAISQASLEVSDMQVTDTYEEEMLGDSLPKCTQTDVLVSVLEEGRAKPVPQSQYGAIYNTNNYMSFIFNTFDPENLGFQLDYFVHEDNGKSEPRHVGFSFILPLDLKDSTGSKKVPITGFKHRPIGQITIDYLLVKPMLDATFNMRTTFQRYWKSTRGPLEVGHRGMGTSYKCKKLAAVRENTVRSFTWAANHGADFIEFDVQLTKDDVPVIYHDFKVLITYRKKKKDDLELFEIPVKEVTLSELHNMKLSHPAYQAEHKYEDIHEDDIDPEDLQPFPTLKRVFESVDIHTGFNIEVKYPMKKVDGTDQQENYFDLNKFVDTILRDVFENHNKRRIVFSSFHPDCCIALRMKQNKYPVLFLTQADSERWAAYDDPRSQSVRVAADFAVSNSLLGVDVVSDVLLKDMSIIKYVKDCKLVLFVWGEDCNNKATIQKMRDNKVDGIIYDRIDFYKTTGKESIFKIEEKKKRQILQRVGSIQVDESPDSGSSGSDTP